MFSIVVAYKDIISVAKDLATILGVLAALLYFTYRVFAGWLLLNLTVSIESERQAALDEDDHLVVNIALVKGKIDSMRLLAAELRLTTPERSDLTPLTRVLGSMERIRMQPGGRPHWNERDPANPRLTLSTEETINLCEHFRVSPGVVYRIEVIVQGDRFRDRLLPSVSQWRGAAIALPTKT